MSTLGDALGALKNVVLMQERLDVVKTEVAELAGTVAIVQAYAVSLDKRIVRLETLVEVASSRAGPPRIER